MLSPMTNVGAASDPAQVAGALTALIGIPVLGLILLIVGLRKRSASRRAAAYQQGGGYWPPNQQALQPFPQYPVPAPPTRSGGTGFIVAGAVLLVPGILGGLGAAAQRVSDATNALEIGDCVTFSNYEKAKEEDDLEAVSCSDEDALLEYAAKTGDGGTCPDGERDDGLYVGTETATTLYCFAWNLRKDECYRFDTTSGFSPSDCVRGDDVVLVADRIDGSTDVTACPAGSYGREYPKPERVYCLSEAE